MMDVMLKSLAKSIDFEKIMELHQIKEFRGLLVKVAEDFAILKKQQGEILVALDELRRERQSPIANTVVFSDQPNCHDPFDVPLAIGGIDHD